MSDIKEKVKFEDAVCQKNREYIDFIDFPHKESIFEIVWGSEKGKRYFDLSLLFCWCFIGLL